MPARTQIWWELEKRETERKATFQLSFVFDFEREKKSQLMSWCLVSQRQRFWFLEGFSGTEKYCPENLEQMTPNFKVASLLNTHAAAEEKTTIPSLQAATHLKMNFGGLTCSSRVNVKCHQ